MNNFIYYTKEGKFETDDPHLVSWNDLHSPNEEIPAVERLKQFKIWSFEGEKHRLTGPAVISANGKEYFYLNGEVYEFKEWVHNHPNINLYLEANGYVTDAQKAIWKLKNL